MRTSLLFPSLLLLLVVTHSSGFLWRRRRGGCSPVNCVWHGWSQWTACNHDCGSAGTKTRTRGVAQHASCGGAGCGGPSSETTACNRFCNNGGTPRVAYCDCTDEYWGKCCPYPCTVISNCERIHCTSGTDQQCRRCQYDRGGNIRAYRPIDSGAYKNRICQQLCSWRPDSRYCYPGVCSDIPDSCRCASGFTSPASNCMTIIKKPDIMHCLGKVEEVTAGKVEDYTDVSCDTATPASTVYTNIPANRLSIDWQSRFVQPSATAYPKPYYVQSFKTGIVKAQVNWEVVRGSTTMHSDSTECNSGYSRDNPNQGTHACSNSLDIGFAVAHADKLVFTTTAHAGGFIKLNNYDYSATPTVTSSKYYTGSSLAHQADVQFDFKVPVHCSLSPGCADLYLDVGPAYTKQGEITSKWKGWSDTPSGIKGYELDVYMMKAYGDELGTELKALVNRKLASNIQQDKVDLANPGLYCFLLTVDDVAGNHIMARKFVLYDNQNKVEALPDADKAMVVQSAAANTSYTWITDLSQQVVLSWKNHFINKFHHLNKLLNAIRAHSPPLSADYEQRTGQPPSTRSMQAIPNVNAVTAYEVQFRTDHEGARSVTTALANGWTNVTNFQAEQVSLDVTRKDGDSIRLFVQASDVMQNKATDNIVVHVDSSPPELTVVGLSKDGHTQLAVHDSVDLYDMRLDFETFDPHAGLHSIRYELHDAADTTKIHDSGTVKVKEGQPGSCNPAVCTCVPATNLCYYNDYQLRLDATQMGDSVGRHEVDYYFMITVTNNAQLVTTKKFKVTVDTSPPHQGVVSDSQEGQPDLDFQASTQQHASWEGFFDKESGVMFYQYAFSDKCLSASDFAPNSTKVIKTSNTWASRQVPSPGTYFCTVVAYNHALHPSGPVCSDGVTVDSTPPVLYDMVVRGLYSRPGLLKEEDRMYRVSRNRTATLIDSPPQACRDAATTGQVAQYLMAKYENGTSMKVTLSTEDCEVEQGAGTMAYLASEKQLEASWFGSDDQSGIYDYQLGLSSTGSKVQDILPFQSTHGHRHYHTYHSGLADAEKVYIHIKAINKAGLSAEQVLGPVTVEARVPEDVVSAVTLQLQTVGGQQFLLSQWKIKDGARDNLQALSLSIIDQKSSSHLFRTSDVSENSAVPGVCQSTDPPNCLAVPVSSLAWHLHGLHEYQAVVRLETFAGHHLVVQSDVYAHSYGPPVVGQVWEAQLKRKDSHDIDVQTDQQQVLVKWTSFHHPSAAVQYQVRLVERDTDAEVAASPLLDADQTEYRFSGLQLDFYKKYISSVEGITSEGNSTASSDGVVVLPVNPEAAGALVWDGRNCSSQESGSVFHHSGFEVPCLEEQDYQMSTSSYSSHWSWPAPLETYIKEAEWQLEEWQQTERKWQAVGNKENLGLVKDLTVTGLTLLPGAHYRSAVWLCHENGCFQPVHSNGFTVLRSAPAAGQLTLLQPNQTDTPITRMEADVSFGQPGLQEQSSSALAFYEWAVMVDYQGVEPRKQLMPWQRVQAASGQVKLTHEFSPALSHQACLVLVVRGMNKVGLSTSVERRMADCHQGAPLVVDAIGLWDPLSQEVRDINLRTNDFWLAPDQEFTRSRSTLQAVWPSLRHGQYLWKVVSGAGINRWAFVHHEDQMTYNNFHCSAPEVLACGQTQANFVNIKNLPLQDGQRYFICIYANETEVEFEKFKQELPEVSVCSNGIVADHEAPSGGKVWIGDGGTHQAYTSDPSSILIGWEKFTDVERHGSSQVHTGISHYAVSLGSSPGGIDVVDYTDVGITNMHMFSNLKLQQGTAYYATVKAYDFVGHETYVTSARVTLDLTPPKVTGTQIQTGGHYLMSPDLLHLNWFGVFKEEESGIASYHWCLGSHPGHCDLQSFTSARHTEVNVDKSLSLPQGQKFFVTIKATNGAGLSSLATSQAVMLDQTPPARGYVLDGEKAGKGTDSDAQVSLTDLYASWRGFHDAESGISSYTVSMGTCSTCDDIFPETDLGHKTDLHLTGLSLQPGQTYYTTVKACSWASRCTQVTSDGIVVDNSPPVLGAVYDGAGGGDLDYQTDRSQVCAHWANVHDVHSGLSHLEWWVGTASGADNILPVGRVHVGVDHVCARPTSLLPLSVRIHVTLKAFNKAGLHQQVTTDGFKVDTSEPQVQTAARFTSTGSLLPNTQYLRSTVHLQWELTDPESGIQEQYLSLMATDNALHHFPTIKLFGDVTEYIFANVTLSDGEKYKFKVIGCNGARLCKVTESPEQLVDNSSPTPGAFAIATEHAVDLQRERVDHMTYSGVMVKLAFLGFADPHTGVTKYFVAVGSKYDSSDLSDGTEEMAHSSVEEHRDEGHMQKVEVTLTRALVPNELIYISIWAHNRVGLASRRLHGSFYALQSSGSSGSLVLNRRCDSQSCQGHCTCGPQDQTCSSTQACTDVTGQSGFTNVQVEDTTTVTSTSSTKYSYYQCTLLAKWKTVGTGKAPVRYEWSVGVKGAPAGTGLIDRVKEPIWRDAGLETQAIYVTKPTVKLLPKTQYIFHIRAWYDENSMAVYTSEGILIDGTPPKLSRSKVPKEVKVTSPSRDIDYITQTDAVTVSWTGVFHDAETSLTSFRVSVGSKLGARDVRTETYKGNTTSATLSGLNLREGHRYFITVEAFNQAGLHTLAHSDGFMGDVTSPGHDKAVVWDGQGLHDTNYQHDNSSISASWHGFYDNGGSFLHHYVWCVGSQPGGSDVVPCKSVGLATRAQVTQLSLVHGKKYYSSVKAFDSAGLSSDLVSTTGTTIDITPPEVAGQLLEGDNKVLGGSFEGNSLNSKWQTAGDVKLSSLSSKAGQRSVLVNGTLSQKIQGSSTDLVKISFWVIPAQAGSSGAQQGSVGYIQLGSLHKAFIVDSTIVLWQQHIYYSHVTPDMAFTLTLGASTGHHFLLDDVQVRPVSHDSSAVSAPPISVDVVPLSVDGQGYVAASWRILDPESFIKKHQWAIGTVKGGVQLQSFRLTHRDSHGRSSQLLLTHGTQVHVTVVSTNMAGLSRVFYADPVTVDFTPPSICCLKVNDKPAEKTQYVSGDTLHVRWIANDPETAVKDCELALGSSKEGTDILAYTAGQNSAGQTDISSLPHGTSMYLTLRCTNTKDLTAYHTSPAIIVVRGPPNVQSAELFVLTSSPSHFPTRGNHQSHTGTLSLGWRGFKDASGIQFYEVKLEDADGQLLVDWEKLAESTDKFAELTGLNLQAYNSYLVSVRAVNHAGFTSQAISSTVIVEVAPPVFTGTPVVSWWDKEWIMNLNWTSLFVSNSSLVYEVTVGTGLGGNDVLTWTETEQAGMRITGVDHTLQHYVSITAVNQAGLYSSRTFPVSYTQPSGG